MSDEFRKDAAFDSGKCQRGRDRGEGVQHRYSPAAQLPIVTLLYDIEMSFRHTDALKNASTKPDSLWSSSLGASADQGLQFHSLSFLAAVPYGPNW